MIILAKPFGITMAVFHDLARKIMFEEPEGGKQLSPLWHIASGSE